MDFRVITNYEDCNKDAWSSFVYYHPNGNIFQTPEICLIYERTKNYEPFLVAVLNSNDEIEGLLLSVIQKEHSSWFGRFSARSIIWGGPLVNNKKLDVLGLLLTEYIKQVKHKAIYSQFRNLWQLDKKERLVFEKNGFRNKVHLNVINNLKQSPNELLMSMHKGRRKNIRRASRIPLEFDEARTADEELLCIQLINNTYKKIKLPAPNQSFFSCAFNQFKGDTIIKKFIAKYHGKIISCRIILCYKEYIYDWYTGADEKHLDKYPNDFLIWKIMEWGMENGFSTFDFGGAGKPDEYYGVRDYKLKFGGSLINTARYEKINNKLLYQVGKIGLTLYKHTK